MSKSGLVGIGNEGYRENPFSPLKPFAEPPLAARPLCEQMGSDFMPKSGPVVDIGNGGNRENPSSPLKPFAEPPLAARPLSGQAAETSPAPREAVVSDA